MRTVFQRVKLFEPTHPNRATRLFGGECSGLLNWDDIGYPVFYEIYKVLRNNFWIPEEVSMNEDRNQWLRLKPNEQEAFRKVIGLLSVLDSIQTRFVFEIARYASDSAVHAICANISNMESIHNQSYSYILSSLTPKHEQAGILNLAKNDPVVIRRNQLVLDLYQAFVDNPTPETTMRALVANTILEGINFTLGFAFFYSLAHRGLMLGTSTIIEFIQRDETQHAYFFALLFRILMTEYPELNTEENVRWVVETIDEAVRLEIEWSRYALHELDHIDLYEFEQYVRYVANKRLRQLGLDNLYEGLGEGNNPMPWITAYDSVNNSKKDFFEQKVNAYSKTAETRGIEEL